MIYAAAIALTIATASATLYTDNATAQKYMWESFKREHNRNYGTMEEETQRFGFFLENLKMVDLRNQKERKAGGTAVHGITKFSDMSQSEFESKMLNADQKLRTTKVLDPNAPTAKLAAEASYVTWVGVYTTPVKDQGYCGSCWAFSATEQIESDYMREVGQTQVLSPEQIVQCDSAAFGCGGGWTESAYGYVKNAGGIETDAAYPYTSYMGTTGTCKVNKADFVVKLSSFTAITGSTTSAVETNMANYVTATGPLSVCLDASSWNSYTGGIMTVCGQNVDHCVQATGVYPATTGGYWQVRNSWGTSWGESGFIQLAYGQNTCDITNDPTWTTVSTA